MPIDWTVFKNATKSYFRSMVAQNEQEAADFITDQYEIAVLTGGDLSYGNVVTTYNKPVLSSAIGQAFIQGATLVNEGLAPSIFGSTISQGLIGFWNGAILAPAIPPPGSTAVVPPNSVTVPGVAIPTLNVSATESEDEFIDNLVDFFTQHLNTLQGITTAIVPTVPPAPAPFPWTGYG
jgi:hypothetical protein